MVERGWVAGPHGDYLVLVGNAQRLREHHERVSLSTFFFNGPWRMLGRRLTGPFAGGRVEVWWHDDVWVWSTADERTALAAGAAVCDLLTSGEWVPQTMPQPALPDAAARGRTSGVA